MRLTLDDMYDTQKVRFVVELDRSELEDYHGYKQTVGDHPIVESLTRLLAIAMDRCQ